MFNQKLLNSQMSRIGCSRVGPLRYQAKSSCENVDWFISFRLLGFYRGEIEGTVAYAHKTASIFAATCMDTLAGKWWADMRQWCKDEIENVSGRFPVSNLAPWSHVHTLNIKELSAQASAEQVANDVESFVLPFIKRVENESTYLRLLIADEKPMQWLFCQPLIRFAEIAYLAARQKMSKSEVSAVVNSKIEKSMRGQLRDVSLDSYLESVLKAAFGS